MLKKNVREKRERERERERARERESEQLVKGGGVVVTMHVRACRQYLVEL